MPERKRTWRIIFMKKWKKRLSLYFSSFFKTRMFLFVVYLPLYNDCIINFIFSIFFLTCFVIKCVSYFITSFVFVRNPLKVVSLLCKFIFFFVLLHMTMSALSSFHQMSAIALPILTNIIGINTKYSDDAVVTAAFTVVAPETNSEMESILADSSSYEVDTSHFGLPP